jgi:RNA polymerase sigma factor (sigma-70 family)
LSNLQAVLAASTKLPPIDQALHAMYFQETGDQEHIDALVMANVRLVVNIAKKNRRNGIDIEDLINEGITGIMRAAETFDPDKGEKGFSNYAAQWIRAHIHRYVQANCGTMRIGTRAAQQIFARLPGVRRQFGSDVSNEVIAQELGIGVEEVNEILPLITCRAASLNAPIGDGSELHEVLPSAQMNQAEAMERTETSEAIAQAIKEFGGNLKPIKAAVLHGRILAEYRGQEKAHAESFGVSRERTRQIENELKTKLQDHFKRCGLR